MKNYNDQQGLVSLMTAVIFTLVLSSIAISATGLMNTVVTQSSNYSNSIRAYYAAEAGVETGLLAVEQVMLSGGGLNSLTSSCSSPTAVGTTGTAYTCLKYSNASNILTGTLAQDAEPLQIDLTGTGVTTATVSWNESSVDFPVTASYTPPSSFAEPLNGSAWNAPAVLELIIAAYPPGNVSGATLNTIVLDPGTSSGSVSAGSSYATPQLADCQSGITYNCQITVNGFDASTNYIIRLKARYAGTNYQLAFSAGGSPVSVPDEFETIDVTAQAGTSYRRLVEKVPIDNDSLANLDYVLFADSTICKNIQVNLDGTTAGCPY